MKGVISVFHVGPVADALGELFEFADEREDRFSAQSSELIHANLPDDRLLPGNAELLLHLDFNGQTMGVPARASRDKTTLHGIDSEVLWHNAEVDIFGALGVPLYESSSRSTKGVFVNEVVVYGYARHPWRGPNGDDVVEMLLERFGSLVESEGRLLPGAIRAIVLTSERGPVALASSTPLVFYIAASNIST